jgi:outer membrane protein assembly factor BamE (lipoprotein component of BamABCDE complex)
VLLVSGCTVARFYNGTPLRGEPSQIVEGQSTKSDVLRTFGPPTQIFHQTNGDTFVYTYEQHNYASLRVADPITRYNWFTYTRERQNRDRLVVLFDFTGVVRSVAVERQVQDMPLL